MKVVRIVMIVAMLLLSCAVQAETKQVTFNVRSWDDVNKEVITTSRTETCTIPQLQTNGWGYYWLTLGETGKTTYYVAVGQERKVRRYTTNLNCRLSDCNITRN